jgi:hypothetical protein
VELVPTSELVFVWERLAFLLLQVTGCSVRIGHTAWNLQPWSWDLINDDVLYICLKDIFRPTLRLVCWTGANMPPQEQLKALNLSFITLRKDGFEI